LYAQIECEPKSYRKRIYGPALMKFAAYVFLESGRRAYNTLCANLPLPKTVTISKYVHRNGYQIKEGVVRVDDLSVFLQSRQLTMQIWLSEDGTSITPRVQFDNSSGEIIGCCLPTASNGLPIVSYFKINSAQKMKEFLEKYEVPSNLYVIMATPLCLNTSNFCLCVFGTSNKFTANDVIKRWNRVNFSLKEAGILPVGVSSDGDTRLLKAMRMKSALPSKDERTPTEWRAWFHSRYDPDLLCGGKLRMRLLNQSNAIIIGK
jgi:hypothetical protein